MNLIEQPGNLETFICGHLLRAERPIGYVFHDFDGSVQMLCGYDDCVLDGSNIAIVGLGHMMDRDESLRELTNLPIGHEAWRSPEDHWVISPMQKEE